MIEIVISLIYPYMIIIRAIFVDLIFPIWILVSYIKMLKKYKDEDNVNKKGLKRLFIILLILELVMIYGISLFIIIRRMGRISSNVL